MSGAHLLMYYRGYACGVVALSFLLEKANMPGTLATVNTSRALLAVALATLPLLALAVIRNDVTACRAELCSSSLDAREISMF